MQIDRQNKTHYLLPDSPDFSDFVTVFVKVEKEFPKNYPFWRHQQIRFEDHEIVDAIIRKVKSAKKLSLYLSLNNFIESDEYVVPYSTLAVLTIPRTYLFSQENDDEDDEMEYSLKRNTVIKPYQIQYSLLMDSKDDIFYPREGRTIINPLYQSLYNACSKLNIADIIYEIIRLYDKERTNVQKNKFILSLTENNKLDIFTIYKILMSTRFSNLADNLLTQCIVNILISSPMVFEKLSSLNYEIKRFSEFLPELPCDILNIIYQYNTLKEIKSGKKDFEKDILDRNFFSLRHISF